MKLDIKYLNYASSKAAKIFTAMQWTWSVRNHKSVDPYVPNIIDIENTLINLSLDVGGSVSSAATGRLQARVVNDGETKEIRYSITL